MTYDYKPGDGLKAWTKVRERLVSNPAVYEVMGTDEILVINEALRREAESDALIAATYETIVQLLENSRLASSGSAFAAFAALAFAEKDVNSLTPASARAALDAAIERAKEEGRCEESYTRDHQTSKFEAALIAARTDGAETERKACIHDLNASQQTLDENEFSTVKISDVEARIRTREIGK